MNKGMVIGILVAILLLAGIGGGIYVANKSRPVLPPVVEETSSPDQMMGDDSMMPETSPEAMEENGEAMMGDTMMKEEAVEVDVTGTNYKFDPATITVKKGDTVKINFTAQGNMPHDFTIDEFNVATKQLTNASETVQFVADKAGTFEYYCSVGNHRALGMVGKLVVQ